MFVQDDYAYMGLGAELSRSNFVVYDKQKFSNMNAAARYNYLTTLDKIYINPYTGRLIGR